MRFFIRAQTLHYFLAFSSFPVCIRHRFHPVHLHITTHTEVGTHFLDTHLGRALHNYGLQNNVTSPPSYLRLGALNAALKTQFKKEKGLL